MRVNFSALAPLRPRADWLPRASLGLGVGSTVAMNVAAGSRGGTGGAAIGALIPVAFVLALETLIWLIRKIARLPWGWLWCAAAGLPLAGLAAITGIVSYLHALTVVTWTGSTGLVAHLIPLVPDQLIVCGSVALMAVAFSRKTETAGAGRAAAGTSREVPAPRQPSPVPVPAPPARKPAQSNLHRRPAAGTPARKRGGNTANAVRVRDLVTGLPPERVEQLAAMSKRDLAAELGVTPWAAEVWQRDRKAANGHELNGHELNGAGR